MPEVQAEGVRTMACQVTESRTEWPSWQRARTCCPAAKKTTLAAEGDREPWDPESVERPPEAAEHPGTTTAPHQLDGGLREEPGGTCSYWPWASLLPLTFPH